MIDFNTIYNAVSPYFGTGAIATFLVTAIALVIAVIKKLKEVSKIVDAFLAKLKDGFEKTENEALKAFKNALPPDFAVNIEHLTRAEIASVKEYFISAINENWLKQITANNDLMKAVANALISLKSIPDSSKKEIAEILKLNSVETTDKLKVSLTPQKEEMIFEKVEDKKDKKENKQVISVD